MSKEFLEKMSCKELRDIAKSHNIQGRWDMTKPELIEAILILENQKEHEKEEVEEKSKDDAKKQYSEVDLFDQSKVKINIEEKAKYLEKASIGSIVAFKLESGKVKTAKVVNKSTKNRKLKLQTEYGTEYIISYDDVLWVKTGKRWPRGIYLLLKGNVETSIYVREEEKESC